MAVRLRLMRMGRKGQPFYRIVAVDSRKRRDGAYIEKIGHYNPRTKPAELVLEDDKALKWLQQGALPSDTVRSFLSRCGILLAWDLQKRGIAEEEIKARVAQFRLEKEASLCEKEKAAIAVAVPEPKVSAPAEKTGEVAAEPESVVSAEIETKPSETEPETQPETTPESTEGINP